VSSYYTSLLGFSFALQDAMSKYPIGSTEHSALAVGVGDLDVLLGAQALRAGCWENRTHTGELINRALYEINDCADADRTVAQLIANVSRSIQTFEPGLAETGFALADETETAAEQHEAVIDPGKCPGPLPSSWTKVGVVCIPPGLQFAALGLTALYLYRVLR
jgi:hypothetical protein